MKPDLSTIPDSSKWGIYNRTVKLIEQENGTQVQFNGQENDGVAWLKKFEFNNVIIEVDIKGKDVQGNSFVGVVFRGVDVNTFDAVYFRPFNFMSNDSVRRNHSVQYVSHPEYSRHKLRNEHLGKYENAVNPVPDPNKFFHAKIVVEKPRVSVFVNDAAKPCLVVNELSDRTGGWIGLWAGNYSDGTFANLKIIKKKVE